MYQYVTNIKRETRVVGFFTLCALGIAIAALILSLTHTSSSNSGGSNTTTGEPSYFASPVFGTPNPLNLAASSASVDLFGTSSTNAYSIYGMHAFPVQITLTSVTISGVIGGNWTDGSFAIELTAGSTVATSASVAPSDVTGVTVNGQTVFSTSVAITGTLTEAFFARLVPTSLSCSDLRIAAVIYGTHSA